jgi:hypothetical protein
MDTYQWLNFGAFIKKSLFIWNPASSGKIDPMTFTPFVYNLILEGLQKLTGQLILSINIYWILFVYFLQFSFFYFYRIFLGGRKALVATLLTFLNIKMITSLYFPVLYVEIALAAFPLMFFLLHSFIFKKKNKFVYAFLYIFFQIVFFRVLNVLILCNILVPALLFLLFKDQISDKKDFFKKVILVWVLSFLVCLMCIINLGISYKGVLGNASMQSYNSASMSPFYTNRDNLLNTFRLTNNFSLADNMPEVPNFAYFKFSKLYMQSWFFIAISFLFFGLLLANFIKNRKNKKLLIVMAFLVALIFLAKNVNPPWGFVTQWLYSDGIYLSLFRSGATYFMYLILPLAVLAIFLGDKKIKMFYPLVFLAIISSAFLIFVYAKPIGKYMDTTLPTEYSEVTGKLDSLEDANKILILPISPQLYGEMAYEDGYGGASRLELLSSKTLVSKTEALGGSDEYNTLFNSIANGMNVNYDTLDAMANILDYRYIIVEKDSVYYPGPNFKSAVTSTPPIEEGLNKTLWQNIFENKDFALYKIGDDFFDGKIQVSSSSLSFEEINPVTYKVYIQGLHSPSQLSFLEAFNPGWKVYLGPNPTSQWCETSAYFESTGVTECQDQQQFPGVGDLSYLYKKPIFDNTHQLIDDYANGWTIDPNYIKKNFDTSYYKENPDGSIDVELTLYFKPQSYYDVGFIVSGTTLLACLGYLGWDLARRRKKKLAATIIIKKEEDV